MIIKAFTGKHIDLSKIVAISDAEYHETRGYGEGYVCFYIYFQLLDSPIEYQRRLGQCDYGYTSWKEGHEVQLNEDGTKVMSQVKLQEQIDDLVEQWKKV
jgi:hypothetical protein